MTGAKSGLERINPLMYQDLGQDGSLCSPSKKPVPIPT